MFYNALTKNVYSQNNADLLSESAEQNEFSEFAVAGYKQWLELGFQVQKGQKATAIFMFVDKKQKDEKGADQVDTKTGETKKEKVMKTAKVFFADQVQKIEVTENA
jgi:antirestriction protein ArdC